MTLLLRLIKAAEKSRALRHLTMTFTETVNTYTVIWKNYDGQVLETDTEVPYGTVPTYDGQTPVKPDDDQYTYTFKSWNPAVSKVEEDTVYTAEFEATMKGYILTLDNRTDGGLGYSLQESGRMGRLQRK